MLHLVDRLLELLGLFAFFVRSLCKLAAASSGRSEEPTKMAALCRSGISLLLVAIWTLLLTIGVRAEDEAQPTFAAVKMTSGDEVTLPSFFMLLIVELALTV